MLNLDLIKAPADFFYVPETASTMEIAAEYSRNGSPHLSAVFAEVQTQGRGRRGRLWQNFAGLNIAVTIIVKGVKCEHLSLLASVVVHKALSKFAKVNIKWPNDILYQGKKLAGLLVEKQGDSYLLGIGINVTTPKQDVLDTLDANWNGIFLEQASGKNISREEILNLIFSNLQQELSTYKKQGWKGIEAYYKANCITLNSEVVWQNEGQEISGTATALTKSGALKIKSADGKMHTINAGDVILQGKTHN